MGIMNIIINELNKDKGENEPKWERLHNEPYQIVQTKNGKFNNPIKASKKEEPEQEYKTYKAEYIDGEMEVFSTESEDKALQEAYSYENEHGHVESVYLMDENYNIVKTIF